MTAQDTEMWDKMMAIESRRSEATRKAVDAANQVIMDASDNSVEETNYLTAKVAEKMMAEALMPHFTAMMRADQENMQAALESRSVSRSPSSAEDVTLHDESTRKAD